MSSNKVQGTQWQKARCGRLTLVDMTDLCNLMRYIIYNRIQCALTMMSLDES